MLVLLVLFVRDLAEPERRGASQGAKMRGRINLMGRNTHKKNTSRDNEAEEN